MDKIFKCVNCNLYTLNTTCKHCGLKTISPKPAKFDIGDKFGVYRRKYKKWVTGA